MVYQLYPLYKETHKGLPAAPQLMTVRGLGSGTQMARVLSDARAGGCKPTQTARLRL